MMDFTGRVALVTGAGRGLGRAYAEALARRGAFVVVHDTGAAEDGTGGDPGVAEAVAGLLRRRGDRASAASAPIGTREECAALVGGILAEHGRAWRPMRRRSWRPSAS